jgi:hypothetical protein
MVPDDSVDFVFSFDSLVHVDATVIAAYIREISRVLTRDGAAFLHHSNLGAYEQLYRAVFRHPWLRWTIERMRVIEPHLHGRDLTVTSQLVDGIAHSVGLRCIVQELVPWRTRSTLIDGFSTIVRADSPCAHSKVMREHWAFWREAEAARQLSDLYDVRF